MKTTIDDLNNHLFETIEMLKNNSDSTASPNEKIDIETAKTIAVLAKNVVEGYKVKANVLQTMSKAENPNLVKSFYANMGIAQVSESNESLNNK